MTPTAHTPPLAKVRPVLWVYLCCLAFWLLTIGTFWGPLRDCLELSLHDSRYSHLILIPIVSLCLTYANRRAIFRDAAPNLRIGLPLLLAALAFGWWFSVRYLAPGVNYRLSLGILVVLSAGAAGFLVCFGARALWAAKFPVLFLLLMIPIPRILMDKIILVLQVGASQLLYALFTLAGTPLYKHAFTFELPGVGIVVAEECTSIHSVWALVIISLLVGHFFLSAFPARACLCLVTVPIATFTNAVRVLVIWFLAAHVNPAFLYGNLHRHGGILFSLLSLFFLLLTLAMLRKLERRPARYVEPVAEAPEPSPLPPLPCSANLSCQLAFGTSASYRPADRPAMALVGVLEKATDKHRQSTRFFVRPADFAIAPDRDHLTIEGTNYTVSAVQEDAAGGKWLSLR